MKVKDRKKENCISFNTINWFGTTFSKITF